MNPEKTWTVVQFEDSSVAAVPTNWIQGDFCHWPSYLQAKLNNSIRKCEPLNTCWQTHQIKIFRNATFDDYITARKKAKIAEETSDLASESENMGLKRKRIQKVLSSSSDDSSIMNESLPPAPKLHKISKSFQEIPRNEKITNLKQPPLLDHSLINIERNDTEVEQSTSQHEHVNVPRKNIAETNRSCVCCEKYLRILLEQNHLLRGITSDILSEVRTIKQNQKIIQKENQIEETHSVFITYSKEIQFPMDSQSDMDKFEEILGNAENFTKAVDEFARFGGSNTYNFLKRIMSCLVSNNLAKTYSWLGRRGKKPFIKLNLSRLLLKAAEKSKISDNIKNTEAAIQSWLKRANERQSQQESRQTKIF